MSKKSEAQDRRARAAQVQAEARRAERRRSWLIIGAAAAVAAVIVGWATIAVVKQSRDQGAVATAAEGDIEGVKTFEDLTNNHVTTPMDYPQTPPVGGDHAGVWTNCGVYTEPIDPAQTTHSLEHGAVWIGYDPSLDEGQVERLADLAERNDYVLLSPVEGVPAPVTVSAWGYQLQLDDADDPRLEVFLQKYQQGEGAPEPGAPCTGGTGGM